MIFVYKKKSSLDLGENSLAMHKIKNIMNKTKERRREETQ